MANYIGKRKTGSFIAPSNVLVMGIDEAGRGPVIGPMIICGVVVKESNILELTKKGVRDSKSLSSHHREELKKEIEFLCDGYELVNISPQQIDEEGMNDLELRSAVGLIKRFLPQEVFLDAPTRNCRLYEKRIRDFLPSGTKIKLVVENFADKNYPIVGAASILAKVERDRRIRELEGVYGSLGSGYPSDEKTIEFLRGYLRRGVGFPPIVRRRWKTIKRVKEECEREVF
ncbi:MAG: ribonuclease HII [Candidatus Aerophobetes bacterium]|nr:ribonuclease HII [Candidatus Aerophobetes bacterium]